MSNTGQASQADAVIAKYASGVDPEVNAALAVVGLSAQRARSETDKRDAMIRVAHGCGASLRQLADAAELNRKTVTAIVAE